MPLHGGRGASQAQCHPPCPMLPHAAPCCAMQSAHFWVMLGVVDAGIDARELCRRVEQPDAARCCSFLYAARSPALVPPSGGWLAVRVPCCLPACVRLADWWRVVWPVHLAHAITASRITATCTSRITASRYPDSCLFARRPAALALCLCCCACRWTEPSQAPRSSSMTGPCTR